MEEQVTTTEQVQQKKQAREKRLGEIADGIIKHDEARKKARKERIRVQGSLDKARKLQEENVHQLLEDIFMEKGDGVALETILREKMKTPHTEQMSETVSKLEAKEDWHLKERGKLLVERKQIEKVEREDRKKELCLNLKTAFHDFAESFQALGQHLPPILNNLNELMLVSNGTQGEHWTQELARNGVAPWVIPLCDSHIAKGNFLDSTLIEFLTVCSQARINGNPFYHVRIKNVIDGGRIQIRDKF